MAQGGRIDYTIGFNVDKSGLQNIQKELAKINQMSAKEVQSINPSLKMNEAMSVLKKAQVAAYDVQKAMNEAFNPTLGITNLEKLQSSLKRLDLAEVQRRFAAIGPTGQKAFLDISKSALTTSVQLKQTSKLVDKIGETLINTVKWQFSSSIVNRFTGAVQQAVGYVQHLDSSLNDIRIVTGKSADEMEKFAGQANKAAQSLGKSTTDYTEAALIYYQQGLSDEEVAARAETTLKTANVTGQSTAAVSEELTAVWNGYRISTEETEAAIDKLAAVAATTASDLQELSTGMSKVASAANAMGVDMDQLNAQIATIISVTRQAPESVGTALKTIYARMGDLKLGETDEDGLGLGDVSGTLEKVGISVLDVNGDLREMGDVMEDVAAKWNTWTSAQQVAIAEVMAGKRQYNNLIALFENWDMYSKALDTSKNSLGTLQQQQDIYMESTEAHVQMLKTEWEDLYDSIIDEDAIKGVSDALRGVLNLVTNLVDGLGGGMTLLSGLFALIGTKFGKQIGNLLIPFIQNIQNAKSNMLQLQQISKNIDLFKQEKGFGNSAAQAMTDAQDRMREYWKLMSEEEINSSMEAIREIGTWTQRKEEIEKTTNKLENYLKVQGTAEQKKNLNQGKPLFNETSSSLTSESISVTVESEASKVKGVTKEFEALTKAATELKKTGPEALKATGEGSEDAKKKIDNFEKELNSVKNLFKEIDTAGNQELISSDKMKKAREALNQFGKRLEQIKNGNIDEVFDQKTSEDLTRFKQILQELGIAYEQLDDAAKNTNQNMAEANRHLDEANGKLGEPEKRIQLLVDGYSKLAGSISSYIFALQSLGNLGSIWTNDDLSAGEKLFQTITNISMALPMLIGGLKNLALGFDAIKEAKAAATAVQTAANVQSGVENAQDTAKIGIKKILTKVIYGEAAAEKTLSTAMTVTLGVMAILAVAYAGIKIASAIHQKNLENIAEADRRAADAAKEHADTLREQKEHLDEIANKYKELNSQIEDHTTTVSDAREEIYNLCKQYDLQELAVKALTADYAELEGVIKDAQAAQDELTLESVTEQKEASKEALKSNAWAGLNSRRDIVNGKQTIDLSGFFTGSKSRVMQKELEGLGLDIDSSGHMDLDQFLEAAATKESEIYEILDKYNTGASNELRKLLSEQQDNIDEYRGLINEEKDLKFKTSANKLINPNEINSLQDYQNAYDTLVNDEGIRNLFEGDDELIKEYVNKYLSGIEEIQEYAQQADISAALVGDSDFTQEDINEQLGKRSKAEINFLVNNKELAEAEGDLDSFFKKYHDEIEYANSSDNRINVEVTLTSALDNGKFDDDTIKKLYEDSDFEEFSKVSQEDFVKMSFQKQTELAQQYYHTLMDNEEKYQESVKQGLSENEEKRRQDIEAAAQAYTALQDRHQDVSVEQMSGDLAAQWSKSMQDVLQVSDEEFETFVNESLSKFAEGGIDALEDMEPEIKNLFDKLIQAGYTEDQLKNQYKLISAYQDYEDVIDKLPAKYKKQGKEISKLCNDYEALSKRANLAGKALKGVDKSVAAMADFKKARSDIKSLNEEIDDLQSNYSSLQNIVEDYNADHMISIDNVQKLMEMDSKYVATLQFEGDQLSINDSMYEGLMQAEAQNMRLKAADLYLSELEAIATGQATEAGVQFELQTYANAQALGELVNMANAGTEALYRLSQVQAAMSKNKEATMQATQAFQNRLALIDNFANQSVSQGLGGGSGSGGGGGSEKDPEHEEYLEREADIYRTINEELEQIESTLGRIQNINDHEWGIDAQKTLEQENKLLDQQLEKLQEKKKLQERDLSTRRKQLEDVGVNFSADGSAMTNAESTLDAMYAHYNSMVDMYNAMSTAEQETYKANLEAEKDRIDKVEKKIDDYESTFSDYQSTLDSLIDVHYQQIENTVKQFNNMVDVHLELDEAKEEWNDFWFDVAQDIEDTDFTKQIEKSVKKLEVLIGTTLSNTDSEVSILTNHLLETVSEVQDQIASANRGGEASIFGDDSALSKETLENYRDQLMEALTSAKEELDNISDSYLDMLDSAQDKIDKQVKAWESIGEHLEHNVSLIKLISGDKSYEALDKIYQQQYQNNLQLLTTQRTSMEYWQNMIDKYANLLQTTEEGSKEWKTYSEAYEKASMNYKEAVSNLDKTIEDALNKLEEWKKSQLDAINETFDRTLSSNLGLDQLEKEWNVINDSASRYFDNVERALEMEGLEDAFDKVIENTKEASRAQQELNQMRDEEIARLNQKTKLSQFDIDEVKARLEIRKQELALEDAQKNKTNLRLRRDSQGNYNYQYTGDDSQIEEASEGLLSAKKEWYELVKNRNIDLAKAVLENRKNLQSELAALDDMYFENDDARRAKQIEIINKYAEREKDIMGDAESAKQIFFDGTAKFFADVENNTVLPQWNTTIEGMIDAWSGGGEDSFTNAVKRGIEEIEKVQDEFNIRTEEILTKAGVNYIKLKETGIDPTIDSLNELTESNEELESALEEVNDQLIEQESYLRNCEQAYNSLKDAAVNAIAQANSALNMLAQTAINTSQQVQAAISAAQSAAAIMSSLMNSYGSGGGSGGGYGGSGSGTGIDTSMGFKIGLGTNQASKYGGSSGYERPGISPSSTKGLDTLKNHTNILNHLRSTIKQLAPVNMSDQAIGQKASQILAQYGQNAAVITYDQLKRILGFASGGYTGAWGSDGKIAMLHEKELVLNKKDTENVLDAVNLLRTFSVSEIADSIIGAAKTSASILASVTSKASQAVAGVSNNQTNNYRDMTINADFSGVKSADAIYQALTELSNYGMQEAYSNSPLANKSY